MRKQHKLALRRETLQPLEKAILRSVASGGSRYLLVVQHSVATTSSYGDGGCTTGCGSGSGTGGPDVSGG